MYSAGGVYPSLIVLPANPNRAIRVSERVGHAHPLGCGCGSDMKVWIRVCG